MHHIETFRPAVAIAVGLFLGLPLASQQTVDLWPGTTTASSRGGLGVDSGETLVAFQKEHWRGLGDNGTACRVQSLSGWMQDQNAATQESFRWVVRSGTDANGPTAGAAGLLHRIGPISVPSNTAGGIRAWNITTTFATPLVIPCAEFFAVGAEMPAAPNWFQDGLSTHVSYGTEADQHPNAADIAWEIVGTATAATNPSFKRAWRYTLHVDNPVFQFGVGTKFGNGGMYPGIGKTLTARIEGGAAVSNALAIMYLDIALGPAGIPVFPAKTRVWLAGIIPEPLTSTVLDGNGNGQFTLGPVPPWPTFTFPFQCLLAKGREGFMTNAHSVTANQ